MRRKQATATAVDPLRMAAPKSERRMRPGTRVTKGGQLRKAKTFNWPDDFARRFSGYCAARDLSYSEFAMWAIEKAMADET